MLHLMNFMLLRSHIKSKKKIMRIVHPKWNQTFLVPIDLHSIFPYCLVIHILQNIFSAQQKKVSSRFRTKRVNNDRMFIFLWAILLNELWIWKKFEKTLIFCCSESMNVLMWTALSVCTQVCRQWYNAPIQPERENKCRNRQNSNKRSQNTHARFNYQVHITGTRNKGQGRSKAAHNRRGLAAW